MKQLVKEILFNSQIIPTNALVQSVQERKYRIHFLMGLKSSSSCLRRIDRLQNNFSMRFFILILH